MQEKSLGADAAAVAFAGSSGIGLPASILDAFDAQFGTDGPDRNSDSVGRDAGCDDCATNVAIRAEHRVFVERVIRAFLRREHDDRVQGANECHCHDPRYPEPHTLKAHSIWWQS
jgi:hypothetical protein